MDDTRTRTRLTALMLIYAVAALVFAAWISDDSMITLRQVDMTVAGEGIVWNPGWRVQAFTHPAWFWLLTIGHALTGSLFYMTIVVSALCALGALWLYARHCFRVAGGAIGAAPFLVLPFASQAFLDYLASGLENPLSFLLVALVFTLLAAPESVRRDRLLWLMLALAVLTRQDHALQLGPLALWLLVSGGPLRQLGRALPGILLLLAWFAFATFYFGSPLPNTFYAKLYTGYGPEETQGMAAYFWKTSVTQDSLTLATVAAGLVAGLFGGWPQRALAAGVGLHLLYLNAVGGDFMQGRMLTVDFFIACFLLAPLGARLRGRAASLPVIALGALALIRFLDLGLPLATYDIRTVLDERRYYYPVFGMLSSQRNWPGEHQPVPADQHGRHGVMLCGFAGSVRMEAPDSVHVVDACGLAEPFLSHVPAFRMQDPRPGHFFRAVPKGYFAALGEGRADWMPGDTGPLFRDAVLVSHAPLFDPDRLRAILRWNTGAEPMDPAPWRNPRLMKSGFLIERQWLTDESLAPRVKLQPEAKGFAAPGS